MSYYNENHEKGNVCQLAIQVGLATAQTIHFADALKLILYLSNVSCRNCDSLVSGNVCLTYSLIPTRCMLEHLMSQFSLHSFQQSVVHGPLYEYPAVLWHFKEPGHGRPC